MSTRLKYNPACYKRLAEIAGWLARGENVQLRRTGLAAKEFGGNWFQFCGGALETSISLRHEYRIKPTKETKQ